MANNILVGDIGSTKSVWRKNFGSAAAILLHGYNPITHDATIGKRLFIELANALAGEEPDFIYYFGAGIIDDATGEQVRTMASEFFATSSVVVTSDMMGACIAACGNHPGTIAILGTGSNCAVFDGRTIVRSATTLGYLIGDEGSGNDIGKQLARGYFYNTMPAHLRPHLHPFFKQDRIAFLDNLYSSGAPNQYLAESVKSIANITNDPWIESVVQTCIANFVNTHLLPLKPEGPVHVIGSIGYIFGAIVAAEITRAGLTPGHFIRDPLPLLFEQLNDDKTT